MKRIDKGIKDENEGIKYWTHFPMEDLTKEQKREIYQAEKDEKKHLKDLERIKKYKEELGRMG